MIRFNEKRKVYEVVDASGTVHAADKSKANAVHLDRALGFAAPERPAFDAIVRGVHGALVGFGYKVDVPYVAEQVEHVLRDESERLAPGPGRMAKAIIDGDVAENHADALAQARREIGA